MGSGLSLCRLSTPFWEFPSHENRQLCKGKQTVSFYSLLGVSQDISVAIHSLTVSASFYSLLGVSTSLSTPVYTLSSLHTFLLPFGSFVEENGKYKYKVLVLSTPFWEFQVAQLF